MKAFLNWLLNSGATEMEMALLEKEFGAGYRNWSN
jgi:hypothetical protein